MGFRRSDFKVNLFLSKLSNFEPQTTLLGEMLSAFSCADVVAFEDLYDLMAQWATSEEQLDLEYADFAAVCIIPIAC